MLMSQEFEVELRSRGWASPRNDGHWQHLQTGFDLVITGQNEVNLRFVAKTTFSHLITLLDSGLFKGIGDHLLQPHLWYVVDRKTHEVKRTASLHEQEAGNAYGALSPDLVYKTGVDIVFGRFSNATQP